MKAELYLPYYDTTSLTCAIYVLAFAADVLRQCLLLAAWLTSRALLGHVVNCGVLLKNFLSLSLFFTVAFYMI